MCEYPRARIFIGLSSLITVSQPLYSTFTLTRLGMARPTGADIRSRALREPVVNCMNVSDNDQLGYPIVRTTETQLCWNVFASPPQESEPQ